MINYQYQSPLTGQDLFVMLYTDTKEQIFNFSTGEFETLICPISTSHVLVLPELECAPGFYWEQQELAIEPQYLIADICEFLEPMDPYDPYNTMDYRVVYSKRFYYNGNAEVGDEYLQLILNAVSQSTSDIMRILQQPQNSGGTLDNDKLNQVFSIVQNIQSMVASRPR